MDQKYNVAYAESNVILKKLNLINKLPENIRKILESFDGKCDFEFDENIPIFEQVKNEETSDVLMYLYIKYICEDEEEKKQIMEYVKANERMYDEQRKKAYSDENLFRNLKSNKSKEATITENLSLNKAEKETFWKKLINKIIKIFKR